MAAAWPAEPHTRRAVILGKKWLGVAVTACIAIGLAVFSQAPAQAVGERYGPYLYINTRGGMCLDNPNSSTANNTQMIVYTCSGKQNQQWYNKLEYTNNDFWTYNNASLLCLTVLNNRTDNNAPIIQFTCNSGNNERWVYDQYTCPGQCAWPATKTFNGVTWKLVNVFRIRHLGTNECITVKNNSAASNQPLLQYNCASPGANVFMQYQQTALP
jgi:hypothetical protein